MGLRSRPVPSSACCVTLGKPLPLSGLESPLYKESLEPEGCCRLPLMGLKTPHVRQPVMVPSLRLGLVVKSCRVPGAEILVNVGALLGLLTPDPSLPAQCLAPMEAPLPLGGLNCPTLGSSPSLSQAPATLPSFSKTYFLLLTSQPALTVSQPASYNGRPRTGDSVLKRLPGFPL